MNHYRYCTRCKQLLQYTEEHEIRGHVEIGYCVSCGWTTPILKDRRIGTDLGVNKQRTTVTIVFAGDNFPIIHEMLEYAAKDGTDPADDIAAILEYFKYR